MRLWKIRELKDSMEAYKKDTSIQFFYYDMGNKAQIRQYFQKLMEYQIYYKEWETIIQKINQQESGLSMLFYDCKDEKKLVEKNIPYEIFGGVRFYQRMEILDILAYLKLIAYDDDVSFCRIVNTPRRRFGRTKMNLLERLRDGEEVVSSDLKQRKKSLFETLSAHLDEREFLNSDMASFVRFIKAMRDGCAAKQISDIVNEVTKDSGYEGYLRHHS